MWLRQNKGCGLKNKGVVEGRWRCNSPISLTAFDYTERFKFILAKGALYQQKGGLLQDFEGDAQAGQSVTGRRRTIFCLIAFPLNLPILFDLRGVIC